MIIFKYTDLPKFSNKTPLYTNI